MCTTKEAADQAGSHKWRELGLFRGKVRDFSKLSKCPDCPERKMLKISELQWSSIAKAPDRAFENLIEIIKKKENKGNTPALRCEEASTLPPKEGWR